MTTLNDLAPWPTSEDEVTAERLARAFTVHAIARGEWAKANVADSHAHGLAEQATAAEHDLIQALQVLAENDEGQANDLARHLWRIRQDGEVGEVLHNIAENYDINPYQAAAAT